MFYIVLIKFEVLHICFNQGSNTMNEPISSAEQCINSGVPLEDGVPIHPHDDATLTELHDGNMSRT